MFRPCRSRVNKERINNFLPLFKAPKISLVDPRAPTNAEIKENLSPAEEGCCQGPDWEEVEAEYDEDRCVPVSDTLVHLEGSHQPWGSLQLAQVLVHLTVRSGPD